MYGELSKSFDCFLKIKEIIAYPLKKNLQDWIDQGYIDISVLKEEIFKANSSDHFSWKSFACQKDYIYYKPEKTDLEIYLSYQALTWEFLFPEKIMSDEELAKIERWLFRWLDYEEWTDFDQIIDEGKKLLKTQELLDYYNLLRYYREFGKRCFELKHIDGTGEYSFRLRKYDETKWSKGRTRVRRIRRPKNLTNLSAFIDE